MTRVFRSYLYVPGHDAVRIPKAYASSADCIVLDLEDAVPPARRSEARAIVDDVLRTAPKPTQVRLGPEWRDDLRSVAGHRIAAVRLPKCESAAHVEDVARALERMGSTAEIIPIVESAKGLEQLREILATSSRVGGLALGEADLQADLRSTSDDGLLYARLRVVSAARARGLPGPIQSVFTNTADEGELLRTSLWGRSVGFSGRSAIHPRQLAAINTAYTPTDDEIERANEIIAADNAARQAGAAASLTTDGRFVDPATVSAARWVLDTVSAAPTTNEQDVPHE